MSDKAFLDFQPPRFPERQIDWQPPITTAAASTYAAPVGARQYANQSPTYGVSLPENNVHHHPSGPPHRSNGDHSVSQTTTNDGRFDINQIEASKAQKPSANGYGFGEIYKGTSGTQFYGPTAALAFLTELRSRARALQSRFMQTREGNSNANPSPSLSIDNLLSTNEVEATDHDDVPTHIERSPEDGSPDHVQLERLSQDFTGHSPASSTTSGPPAPNLEIEKECVQLYFANLHLIYNFVDKASFMARCEREIWSMPSIASSISQNEESTRFLAMYHAVLAVGAITAGDDTVTLVSHEHVRSYIDRRTGQLNKPQRRKKNEYAPLELAQFFFTKAKALLGDFTESSSLETIKTLFLMVGASGIHAYKADDENQSIFCQHALKPHACYMYSAMAVRTAFATGSVNQPDVTKNPLEAIRTWWCMYYHEMEICCSLGRETFLREPAYYSVYLAKWGDPLPTAYVTASSDYQDVFFQRAMTELGLILKRTTTQIYSPETTVSLEERSKAAIKLDEELVHWRSQLHPVIDLEGTSLTEREAMTKKKTVIKLRYNSARILIHRSLLVASAYPDNPIFMDNIKPCIEASEETIQLLYITFMNRPFFRTWWYNTTYAFNAIAIILYALVSHLYSGKNEELLNLVEKSLKIFQAMDGIAVARQCAELTQEIFSIAKTSSQPQRKRVPEKASTNGAANARVAVEMTEQELQPLRMDQTFNGGSEFETSEDAFFESLMDPTLLESFGTNLNDLNLEIASICNFDVMGNFGP